MQNRHQNLTGPGSGIRLRAEADFSGNNKRTQLALGQVVVRRNSTIISPMVKSLGLFSKDVLNFLDGWMLGLTVGDIDNFVFDLLYQLLDVKSNVFNGELNNLLITRIM